MQFTVQKLYTNKVDLKIQGRFLLLAKIKKEGLDLPFHQKQFKKNRQNNETVGF